jgi:aspartate ammonia-lyase
MAPSSSDPLDRMTEPARPQQAASYLIEMLSSMAHFAHISDLQNSSAMLAAASRVVEQECRLLTSGPPEFRDEPPKFPFPFGDQA